MNRRKIRGILSIFLATALLLSCIPMAFGAFAAEGYTVIGQWEGGTTIADQEVALEQGESLYIVLDTQAADGEHSASYWQQFPGKVLVTLNGTDKAWLDKGGPSEQDPQSTSFGFTLAYSTSNVADWSAAEDKSDLLLENLSTEGVFVSNGAGYGLAGWGAENKATSVFIGGNGGCCGMVVEVTTDIIRRPVLMYTAEATGTYTVSIGGLNESTTDLYLLSCKHESKNLVADTDRDATCTAYGYTGNYTCNDCGVTVSGALIAKLAHDYVAGVCSVCNKVADPTYEKIASAAIEKSTAFQDVFAKTVTLKAGESLYVVLDPVDAEGATVSGGFWNSGVRPNSLVVKKDDTELAVFGNYVTDHSDTNFTYAYSYTALTDWKAADADKHLLDNFDMMVNYDEAAHKVGTDFDRFSGEVVKAVPAGQELGETAIFSQDWACLASDVTGTNIARAVLQFTAEEDGDYDVSFTDLNGVGSGGTLYLLKEVTGYAVEISGPTENVKVDTDIENVDNGEKVNIKVDVTNIKVGEFAAAELTLTYDTDLLTYVGIDGMSPSEGEGSSDGYKITNIADGTSQIKISDFGEPKKCTNGVYTYTIKFIANPVDDTEKATVTLTAAAFGTQDSAIKDDLTPATLITDTATFTIMPADHTVSVGGGLSDGGVTSVEHGKDYTFYKSNDGDYYDYTSVTATMGSGKPFTVEPNADGSSYTIANVTGDLVITAERTEKKYNVTINIVDEDGKEVTDDPNNNFFKNGATYGTEYLYKLPDNRQADENVGYTYAPGTVTIGGDTSSLVTYTDETRTYTIPGSAITGDIVINIVKTVQDPTKVKVTNEGEDLVVTLTDDEGNLVGGSVDKGTNITLSFTPEDGYIYTITYTMGEETKTFKVTVDYEDLVEGKFSYTIKEVKADVSIVGASALDISEDNIDVGLYLDLDETSMWLITINRNQITDKTYTYKADADSDSQDMFWSSQYNAYCILVISSKDAPKPDVDNFKIANYAADAVTYDKDVNMSKKLDTNDAQLVYNMYNVQYLDFDTVTMEKFLRADVNNSKDVNTEDAAAIVNGILTNA